MRAIDADALIDKYGDWYTEEGTEEGYIGTIKGIVDSMPTIEPERKKGKWLDTIEDGWWQCSNCEVYWQKTIVESCNIIYCPNCGVKMGK